MKKLFLIFSLTICSLFSNDFWETGWHQGNSMYHIENSKGDRIELACSYSGGSFTLLDEKNTFDEIISFIINDETKLNVRSSIREDNSTNTEQITWGNLIYELPNAKKIIIQSGKKSYTFEPKNSKKALEHITESCLEFINN